MKIDIQVDIPAFTFKAGPVQEAIAAAGQIIRSAALNRIRKGPKTGRTYPVPGTKSRTYRASAPGQSPAQATGRLLGSIRVEIGERGLLATVGSDLKYAPWLEFGTAKASARPYLRPAVEESTARINELISKAIEKAIQG